MISTVIVDDEPLARCRLRTLLLDRTDIIIVGEYSDGMEAVAGIRATAPALAFLDVQMPEMDGLDVLATLSPAERPRTVVFVTAHDRYAIAAFDVHAVDYLMKPYNRARLDKAVHRAACRLATETLQERIDELEAESQRAGPGRVLGRCGDIFQPVRLDEVDWLEADRNYVRLHVSDASYTVRMTFAAIEGKLDPGAFTRVHRSVIVKLDRVLRLEPWSHGEYTLILHGGARVNVSRTYAADLRRRLNDTR